MSKKMIAIIIVLIGATYLVPLFPAAIRLQAVKTGEAPNIDGNLNDTVWEQAVPFTNFKTVDPEVGKRPDVKTEVRVLYDAKNLYIGVTCFNGEAEDIIITDLRHDQGEWSRGNDLVRILIDPFQDKRNAYVFFVTAGGARTDGLAAGEHMSTNWDGIWEAKSKIAKHSWSTEICIPFKTISFKPGLRTWGFNVERYIPKKMETIRLSGISRDSFFYNPVEAALLEGIEGIEQGNGLTFKPFTAGSTSVDHEIGEDREWSFDYGFDLYKSFTPNLVGVLTYNTDFAETEVDERQINLTRFPLYFPEKRSFFLEGSDIFRFGSGLQHSFIPFFSRNIGLYEEEQIPVHYGAKVFGKIGRTNMVLLDVRTRPYDELELGGQNFFAGRVYQDIFAESKAGIIFTSGDPAGQGSNQLVGFDFNYQTSRLFKNKNFAAGAWWVYNWNQLIEGSHQGWGLRLDYPNDFIDTTIAYRYLGDALEPGLAYLPRNSVKSLQYRIQLKPRPQKGLIGKIVRQYYLEFYTSLYWSLDGRLESSRIFTAPVNFRTESGEHFEINIIPEKDRLDEAFELSEDFLIPVGDYEFTRYRVQFHSASHRNFSTDIEYSFGGYYGGDLSELEIGLSYKYRGYINIGLEGVIIRGEFPQGEFNKNLYRLKADLYLNSDLCLMNFIQYDDVTRELALNSRFRWRISPGNTIYLVYNRGWERSWDPQSRFLPLYDRGVFKIQLTWRP